MRPDADLICLQVEVSGWDTKGRFFVEHSVLDCFESGEKALSLRHKVGIRSVVFVRSLYSAGFAKSYPEAHHVEKVEPRGKLDTESCTWPIFLRVTRTILSQKAQASIQ